MKDFKEISTRLKIAKKNVREVKEKNRDSNTTSLGKALKISTELVAAVVVGSTIGFLLDNWFDTKPLLTICFFILGVVAGILNVIRSAKKINLVPSAMMGKLLVTLIALFFIDNPILKGNDLIIIPFMCILCVAIPFVLVTIAPRFITAAEVNLFFLLETILGPIWVWLVINEQPSLETIIGGSVIISTIATHSFLALKKT